MASILRAAPFVRGVRGRELLLFELPNAVERVFDKNDHSQERQRTYISRIHQFLKTGNLLRDVNISATGSVDL